MGFGTSVLLDALGPDSFCAPQSVAIYREIRLFEISRAALFQQSTVLANDRWLLFDQTHRTMSRGSPTPLEQASDLFLKLVDLHQGFVAYSFPVSVWSPTEAVSIEPLYKKSHQTQRTALSPSPPAASTPSSPTSTTPSLSQPQPLQQTSPSSTTTPCQSTSPASAITGFSPTKSTSPCKRKRYSIMPRASSPGVARLWKMVKSPLLFCCYLCVLLGIDAVLCKGVVRF